jgi:hypothetical protein
MNRSTWPYRFTEWVRDRCHIYGIRREYRRKSDQEIDPRQYSTREEALFNAILKRVTDRAYERSEMRRKTDAVQQAKAVYERAWQAERALWNDRRFDTIEKEYTELAHQTLILRTEGEEPTLPPKATLVVSVVLLLADFLFMLYALTKGIDVPFPLTSDFGDDPALNGVKFLGALTLSVIGPTIVVFCARHIATKLADLRASRLLAERSGDKGDRDGETGVAGEPTEDGEADDHEQPFRWSTLLRDLGRVARKHTSVIAAAVLIAFVACIYYFTAAARLEADGRVPDSLVQGVAALLLGLPPTTVIAHISSERSSRHRAHRDATDRYVDLMGQRASRARETADALAAWDQAWVAAVQLQADLKTEIAADMVRVYPRFEYLVLTARSKVDRAPLYRGRSTLPNAPDWEEWTTSGGPLRSPLDTADTDSLAPADDTLQYLRPPEAA